MHWKNVFQYIWSNIESCSPSCILWACLSECCACPPSSALLISPVCFGRGDWDQCWELCEELVRSPLAAAELSSAVRGAVSALGHGSSEPSWALALWQRWCLKWHSGNRHCSSYLDWRLFLVYLLNAFTLILQMGMTGPVEKDCLSDCPSQAAGGGKSLSLQLSSGRLDGLCLPQPGPKEPSQATLRAYSTISCPPAFCSHGFVPVPASRGCSLKAQSQQRGSHTSVSCILTAQ